MKAQRIFGLLAAAVMLSALAVVYTKHHSRQLFIEFEALKAQRDGMDIEWNRLLLEQATWATPTRVEMIARDRLQMTLPAPEQIVIVD
ncbi:MAG: cell division protein FtsL [Gammaproteobacteria bacterium]|nr:cell division protein FtsL [Gammaproteobacteria bacterium]